MFMYRFDPPVMLNEAESPPAPMPYVAWPARIEFCADIVPTVPGASLASIEVLLSTMYQLPRFCGTRWRPRTFGT